MSPQTTPKRIFKDNTDGKLYHVECLTPEEIKEDMTEVKPTTLTDETCDFCGDFLVSDKVIVDSDDDDDDDEYEDE